MHYLSCDAAACVCNQHYDLTQYPRLTPQHEVINFTITVTHKQMHLNNITCPGDMWAGQDVRHRSSQLQSMTQTSLLLVGTSPVKVQQK